MAKRLKRLFCWVTVFILSCLVLICPVISNGSTNEEIPLNQHGIRSTNPNVVDRFVDANGRSIDKILVSSPPYPPAGLIRPFVANLPKPNIATFASSNTIANVPASTWAFGCSATSAAMMFGHYDNAGYDNMYAGPYNSGVFPMTNATWGTVVINGETRALNPLSATRYGLDGRTIRGHVDDYWVKYGSTAADPFVAYGSEHTKGACTADYMGTNQNAYGNSDGSTHFWMYTNGDVLYDYNAGSGNMDGCHGMKLFVESRGYAVQANGNFSQYIYPYSTNTHGFTYADFKTEVDAGRPVLIQIYTSGVGGHTMLGFGYSDPSTIYIHDTWDYSDHTMTWGGTYGDMQHYGVTVLKLAAVNNPVPATSSLSPSSKMAGDAGFTLTVNGSNFVGNSVVRWNNVDHTTTFVSVTQLTTTISAADIATADTVPVTVFNPTPGGGTSSAVNFTVNNPLPVITSLSQTSATNNTAVTLTVNGSNFVDGSSVVRWNGANLTTAFVSATQLKAYITAAETANTGAYDITVFNSMPGGGTSSALTFTVTGTSAASSGGGGGGGCFIATAAFGTPLEKHVQILRDFRDRCLLTSSAGQVFVKFYYEVSPPIAGKIAQNEGLRFMTRCSLMPLVGMAYLMVTYGAMAALLFAFSIILLMGALVWIIRRKMVVVKQ